MIIAINTIIAVKDGQNEHSNFIRETFFKIISQQANHHFIIIVDKEDHPFSSFANVRTVVSFPQRKNLLQWYWWFNYKIPAILKKHNADVFFSCCAVSNASLHTWQCLFIKDLSFILQPSSLAKKDISFYKKFFQKSIHKADKIFTVSKFCKEEISKFDTKTSAKTVVVYKGINSNIVPMSADEKEKLKATIAEGNEYFVYIGIVDESRNLINLLKAFSAFKKRQKSNMQLIIGGDAGLQYENFMKQLSLFKFKQDVKVFTHLSSKQTKEIIAAGYAFIDISLYECFPSASVSAMQLSVPVIASLKGAMQEICGGAALYADPENVNDIATQMMHLFKDEKFRKKMIEKGNEQAQKFNWNNTADLLWTSVQKSFLKNPVLL